MACLTAGGIANDPGLYRRIWMLDWMALGMAGVVASHLLRSTLTHPHERPVGWRLVLWLLPRFAAASAVMWGLRGILVMVLEPPPYDVPEWRNLVYVVEVLAALCSWTGVYLAYDYYLQYEAGIRERLRLDAALKEAQLRALKAQVNPHFLFNSLNTLRALIPAADARPRQAVTLLADLLRAALDADQRQTVPFEQELAVIENYLALQKLRFEGRLTVNACIDPAALQRPVPPFLIQGLVENAVKYGVEPRTDGGEIALTAGVRDGTLRATVANAGRIARESDSTCVGLSNGRDRLKALFGPEASLSLRQADEDHVIAEVAIPGLNGKARP